jgi:hypothetical protein
MTSLTWNRRIVRHKEIVGAESTEWYQFHEVYYRNDKIEMWTRDGIAPGGETMAELIAELQAMLELAQPAGLKSVPPVLNAEDLPK